MGKKSVELETLTRNGNVDGGGERMLRSVETKFCEGEMGVEYS